MVVTPTDIRETIEITIGLKGMPEPKIVQEII